MPVKALVVCPSFIFFIFGCFVIIFDCFVIIFGCFAIIFGVCGRPSVRFRLSEGSQYTGLWRIFASIRAYGVVQLFLGAVPIYISTTFRPFIMDYMELIFGFLSVFFLCRFWREHQVEFVQVCHVIFLA